MGVSLRVLAWPAVPGAIGELRASKPAGAGLARLSPCGQRTDAGPASALSANSAPQGTELSKLSMSTATVGGQPEIERQLHMHGHLSPIDLSWIETITAEHLSYLL